MVSSGGDYVSLCDWVLTVYVGLFFVSMRLFVQDESREGQMNLEKVVKEIIISVLCCELTDPCQICERVV